MSPIALQSLESQGKLWVYCRKGGNMTETAVTPEGGAVITADPFSPENLAEPHALHEQLREAGPVVCLASYGIWGMARYEQVNAALKDWETFSSGSAAGRSDSHMKKPCGAPM